MNLKVQILVMTQVELGSNSLGGVRGEYLKITLLK